MTFTTTVTQKGQVTLPKAMREQLKIDPYDQVVISMQANSLMIKPVKSLLDLAGKLKPRKNANKSSLEARTAMDKQYQPGEF